MAGNGWLENVGRWINRGWRNEVGCNWRATVYFKRRVRGFTPHAKSHAPPGWSWQSGLYSWSQSWYVTSVNNLSYPINYMFTNHPSENWWTAEVLLMYVLWILFQFVSDLPNLENILYLGGHIKQGCTLNSSLSMHFFSCWQWRWQSQSCMAIWNPNFYHLFLHTGSIFAFFASWHLTSIYVFVNFELQHFTRYWRRGGIIVCHGHFQDVCLPRKLCFFARPPSPSSLIMVFTGCLSLCEPQTTTNLWVSEFWFWILGAHYNGCLPYISV